MERTVESGTPSARGGIDLGLLKHRVSKEFRLRACS